MDIGCENKNKKGDRFLLTWEATNVKQARAKEGCICFLLLRNKFSSLKSQPLVSSKFCRSEAQCGVDGFSTSQAEIKELPILSHLETPRGEKSTSTSFLLV